MVSIYRMSAVHLYVHVVWTTLDRRPMINPPTRDLLLEALRRTAVAERAEILSLAILKTHVHLLVRLPARFDLPHFLQAMKGGSSYVVNRDPSIKIGLRWAPEYSATSVSPRSIARVTKYIETQVEHHPGEGIPG